VRASKAIEILSSVVSEFDRKEELQRALEVFKVRLLAAEEKETHEFMAAAKFVSFSHYDFESDILAIDDLIEELEDRGLL
jgi:hypothetical protein